MRNSDLIEMEAILIVAGGMVMLILSGLNLTWWAPVFFIMGVAAAFVGMMLASDD